MCECECEQFVVPMCQPCDELATCPGCTQPSPSVSWDLLISPCGPEKDKGFLITDGN